MFGPTRNTYVDGVIIQATEELQVHEVTSEEYATVLERLGKLHKMRQDEKPNRVSPDTAVLAGANILGIMMILRHESLNVITSKALSFVRFR